MKKCKQCGMTKSEDNFRKYYPRGNGIRNTTQSRNTICLSCEKLNATVNRVFRNGPKSQTDHELLAQAEVFYKTLVDKGLQPIGAYAAHVRGDAAPKQTSTALDIIQHMKNMVDVTNDPLMIEYNNLLEMNLDGITPDEFEAMIDSLESRTPHATDGKVVDVYHTEYLKLLDRHAEFEDNYEW